MPYHSKRSSENKLKNVALIIFGIAVLAIIAWIFYLIFATPSQAYL